MYIYICICITFFALTLCYTSFFSFLLYIVFIHVIVHVYVCVHACTHVHAYAHLYTLCTKKTFPFPVCSIPFPVCSIPFPVCSIPFPFISRSLSIQNLFVFTHGAHKHTHSFILTQPQVKPKNTADPSSSATTDARSDEKSKEVSADSSPMTGVRKRVSKWRSKNG